MNDGNPEIKARVRRVQREISKRRDAQGGRDRHVVITNPTHYAVALSTGATRTPARSSSPRGATRSPEDPRDRARQQRPIVENPRARARHADADVGDTIPGPALRRRRRSARLPDSHPAVDVMTPKKSSTHLVAPIAALSIVLLMIVPLPSIILDLLLSIDIALGRAPPDGALCQEAGRLLGLSLAPAALTLMRLSLNVASTRLILMHGADGVDAAGHVIMSFGQFVVGGNFVVGIVVFVVLIAIQFLVINHGAVRISGSDGAVHPRRHARPADGDRRRSQRRADRRASRRRRAAKNVRAKRTYGAMDGAVRFTQREALCRGAHHRRQHRRRPHHRRLPARARPRHGGRDSTPSSPSVRTGDRDPGPARSDLRRPHHHAGGVGVSPG